VVDARDEQQETKEQFKTTLERFNEVVNFDGGELEEKYEILNAEFNRCEAKADDVKDRIAAVEDVGEALFKEWTEELDQYTNAKLRRSSQQKLIETRREYDQLIRSMHRAEDRIDPVLAAFRDQVLFLKHNLNASAIASLKNELAVVEIDVDSLIREMETAIAEADGFIKTIIAAR
jgi:chromosome segregation ATPase